MYQHEYKLRVRYGDTDQMGYVYYGNFAQYYEVGRAELLRELGFTYRRLEDEGVMCPVRNMHMRFLRAPTYDEDVTLLTTIRKWPGKTITLHTEIYLENGKLANAGSINLAFVDKTTGKSVSAPQELLDKLGPYFGEKA
ncbi:MAG: thioesterase family protein [Bacteroidota bacterium]